MYVASPGKLSNRQSLHVCVSINAKTRTRLRVKLKIISL